MHALYNNNMALRKYPTRLLLVAVLSSLLILALCGTVAVYLLQEQSRTAAVLGEDIDSRREAADLEETLTNLIALHQRGVTGVEPLHARIEAHLRNIDRYANKEQEREFERDVAASYRSYLRLWANRASTPNARQILTQHLQEDTLAACQRLRGYNTEQIEESEHEHQRSLKRMTWGMAIVGALGAAGSLVLGYSLARSLRETIQQFMVRVEGASELLGQELPAVKWQGGNEVLRDGVEELLHRVEQVVLKLHQSEREVRRAEQLAAVGQLAAGMAHEIRNPLTAAILLIQASRKDDAARLTNEDLELIEGELQRIEGTLQLFLDFARPPKLERSECDLASVIREAMGLARGRIAQQRVEVSLDAPEACTLEGDRVQLRQVFLNLILNALDVMPGGGRLEVGFPQTGRTGSIEVSIRDSGPGITPAMLPRLFEPFATGKETGLGLGLVVSQRIVEGHGGTLQGFNRPEGGACFVVRLPQSAA